MLTKYSETKPCKNPNCKRQVTVFSRVEYCGPCQIALNEWKERNSKFLKRFNAKDQEFLANHRHGCVLSVLLDDLGMKAPRNVNKRILSELRLVSGKKVRWVGINEVARILDLKHNWVTLAKVAQNHGKSYETLENYARTELKFFGPIRLNFEGRESMHVSIISTFEARWQKAKRHFREMQTRSGKIWRKKDATKPWVRCNKKLTQKQLMKKYVCSKCKYVSYVLGGATVNEGFIRNDANLISLHPNGCTLDELQAHLNTSGDLFDRSVREGKINLREVVREGRRVHRFVSFDEMCRILSLMHNRVAIAQLASNFGKDLAQVTRLYRKCGFGPILENFSGDQSVSRCFAAGFLACHEAGLSEKKPTWQSQRLEEGEITSLEFSRLLECNHSTTDRWFHKGKLQGRRDSNTIIFSFEDIKVLILEAAAKKSTVSFSLLEPCLAKPPLCEERLFLKRVKSTNTRTKEKKGGMTALLAKDQFCAFDLAQMSGVKPQSARNWLAHFMTTEKIGKINVVALPELKRFILAVLRHDYPVQGCWARNMLSSSRLKPMLKKDQRFMREVQETIASKKQ